MFEGLVQKLLLGYLGRYIKDIQREQLKITVWNGIHIFTSLYWIWMRYQTICACNLLQRKSCWRTWSWFLKRLTICSCLLLLSKVCDINGFFFVTKDDAFNFNSLLFFSGRVGKLSIKIPWKKIGWEPIIIKLEDVFISATQRSDQEVTFFLILFLYTTLNLVHGYFSGVQMWLRKESLLARKLSLLLQNWRNCPSVSLVSNLLPLLLK